MKILEDKKVVMLHSNLHGMLTMEHVCNKSTRWMFTNVLYHLHTAIM